MPGSVPGSVATSGEVGVVSANEASEYRDGQTEHVDQEFVCVELLNCEDYTSAPPPNNLNPWTMASEQSH